MLSNSRKKEGPPNGWGLLLVNCFTPDVPVVSNIRASSLKSSVWRGVVFVALVVGLMAMGRSAWAFSCSDVTEIPQTECEALVALYDSTDGANWTNNTGWLQTNTPCWWYGLQCSNGHVIALRYQENGLKGTIPSELGNFENLQYLFLNKNQLSGSIPQELGNLKNLQILLLDNNQLSESIPLSFINLVTLSTFNFYGNAISLCMPMDTNFQNWASSGININGMGSCGEYEALVAFFNSTDGNNWTRHNNWLENNTYCQWEGVNCAANGNVISLHLGNNNLNGAIPSELGNLANLLVLQLEANKLTGNIPSELGNLANLQYFYFNETDLCEPTDTTFQNWLSGVRKVGRTGLKCESTEQCPNSTCNVSKDGSDETGNGSKAKAFATIQHGIDVAKDDYTVLVHAGTYVENINFNGKNIIVKSTDGAEKTVIDGNKKDTVLLFRNGEKTTVDGFTLTHGYGVGTFGAGGGIGAFENSEPILKNLIITDNVSHDGGGVVCNTANPTLINVEITKNTSHVGAGIFIDNCHCTLKNVTVADNHSEYSMGGGLFSHSSGKLNAINSIFWNNTPNNINTWGTPAINFSYSDVKGGWEGEGNLDIDPLFENGYHLSKESPVLGLGTSENVPTTDLVGNLRPNPEGSNPDMGAYESVLGSTTVATCPATPSIESTGNGNWFEATTWTANRVPNENDVVMIKDNHTVTIPTEHEPLSMLKGFCNFGVLTSETGSKIIVNTIDFFYNKGKIQTTQGNNGSCPEGVHDASKYIHATAGNNIIIWTDEFVNDGKIIAGMGGNDSTYECLDDNDPGKWAYWVASGRLHKSNYGTWSYQAQNGEIQFGFPSIGGIGGQIEINSKTFANTGMIEGGNGGAGDSKGDVGVHGTSIGGQGGKVIVNPTDIANSYNSGILKGGCGGHADIPGCWRTGDIACNANNVNPSRSGKGGDVIVNIANLSGVIKGCPGSSSYWDPITLKASKTARIEGSDHVEIFGREDWKLDLAELPEGAISAIKTITIALGKGSTIDLRGVNKKIFVAGQKVEIFADNVLLDKGVTLEDLVEAPIATIAPAKVIRRISLAADQQIVDKPATIVPVELTILNGGTTSDSYSLEISDVAGWLINSDTAEVTLDSQASKQVIVNVTLPDLQGQSNLLTIKVTSKADSEVSEIIEVHLATEGSYIAPIGKYSTSGTIRDDLNNPIEGVTLQIGDQTVTTDAAGNWEIGNLPEGKYTVTATKDGLTFMPVDFEVGNGQLLNQIKLEVLNDIKARIFSKIRGQKAEQGKNITYVITVVNGSDKMAINNVITYQIPTGTELVRIQGMGEVICNGIVCNLPDLPVGASAKIEVELSIGKIPNTLVNQVTLTSNDLSTDVAKSWTRAKPYLSIFGKATPSPVIMGGTLHYLFDIELNDNAPNGEATGINLTVALPKGLTLESAPANCNTDNLPVINCSVDNLSVETPEDISKITISIDTIVEEPGLIKLITKAKVTSDNYAAHSSKVRVEVDTRGVEVDGVIVMDVTNSMGDQLNGIIRQVKQRLIDGFADGATPLIAVVTFRDEDDIKLVAATRNLTTLLEAVESLEAKDGGMCPEASADALLLGLSHLKQKGTLIFVTDAPPYDDAETQATLAQIKQLLIDKEINKIPIMAEVNCDGGN